MSKNLLTAFLSLLLVAACATSSKPRISPDTPILEPVPEFLARQVELRENLQDGHPRQLNDAEWQRFEDIQGRFETLLGGVDTVDVLNVDQKIQLYNARMQLVAVLVGDDEEYVCINRKPPTGTRIGPSRQCIRKSRLEQEDFATESWRQLFLANPSGLDVDAYGPSDAPPGR